MNQKLEEQANTKSNIGSESRSEYQKRKRNGEKKKQKTGTRLLFLTFVFVILAGVLCGTVIASTMNTPQDTVQIASANANYVKNTVVNTVAQLTEGLGNTKENEMNGREEFAQDTEQDVEDVAEEAASEQKLSGSNETIVADNQEQEESATANAVTTESAVSFVSVDNPFGIDPSKPMLALTFDDGPSQYTWPIVQALQQYNARATFFLVGNRVATHKAAIDYLLANDQEVATHSFSHANLVKCTDTELMAQINNPDVALQKQHGYTPTLFRVPYGERDARVLEALRQQGKPAIGWSVDPRDWDVQNKDVIVQHVLSHVKDGDIVLMHDIYQPTADAVAELVPALQEQGYQLVTVSELLAYKGIAVTPGTYYYASWKWS